jgi:transcriptional regulator with XRE-family HTH domain
VGTKPRSKPKDLAAKLFAVRQKLELSQSQMAKRIGLNVSPARVSEYESGVREPNLTILLAYAQIAGVHMETLVNDNLELPE